MFTIAIYYEINYIVLLKFIMNTFKIKLLCWVPKYNCFQDMDHRSSVS